MYLLSLWSTKIRGSEQLLLRDSDWSALFNMWCSPILIQTLIGKPRSKGIGPAKSNGSCGLPVSPVYFRQLIIGSSTGEGKEVRKRVKVKKGSKVEKKLPERNLLFQAFQVPDSQVGALGYPSRGPSSASTCCVRACAFPSLKS